MIIPFCRALRIPKVIGTPTTIHARGSRIFCIEVFVTDATTDELV